MSLNSTPSSERVQIGFFGKTNSGKSSLINAITNQNLSIVSSVKGTTTDPVNKSMELLPLGPVNIIDTAGYNDDSELGILRTEKTMKTLLKTDIAILVCDAREGLSDEDKNFIRHFETKGIKYLIAYNKCDLAGMPDSFKDDEIYVSAVKNININELKEKIAALSKFLEPKRELIGDIIQRGDKVILVTPIDSAAPKGRLILPQQQVLRDTLDHDAIAVVVKESELEAAIEMCPNPKVVITDSQVFGYVNKILSKEIKLTSFSIVFARYKGILETAVNGVRNLERLKDGDTILISEGCTHHRQCDDIGTVKLPKWIKEYTKKELSFEFSSGTGFPDDLSKYAMIIHCGGCMLNEKEVLNRYETAKKQNIPISNYGITIAYINGILDRSIEIFPSLN